ncbi:MAG: sensor histidine kinase [Gemmatimonadota bacterium]
MTEVVGRDDDRAARDPLLVVRRLRSTIDRLREENAELVRANEALRAREARLVREIEDTRALQQVSADLIREQDLDALHRHIVDALLIVMRSDAASMQMLDQETNELALLCWRGFAPESARFWARVDAASASACGAALAAGERVVVEDVEASGLMAGTRDHEEFRRSGLRAVQSTPLRSRTGGWIGMISTHWKEPHIPAVDDFARLDLLARPAADLIERTRAEQALREAKEAAEHASTGTSRLLSSMSHDLRTPLTAMLGLVDLLKSEVGGPMSEKQREYFSRMTAAVRHQLAIIDEILPYTRSEAGEQAVRRSRVDVAAIVREVVGMLAGEARAQGLELRLSGVDGPAVATTDGAKVKRILTNLVGNALRYTREGVVDVALEASDDRLEIHVSDTGPGIAAEALEEIFEPLVQLHRSTSRTRSGAGLGLAICRDLARLLGGDVTVESETGRGSTFTVRLPRSA